MADNMTEFNKQSKLDLEWHQHACLCFAIITAVSSIKNFIFFHEPL